MYARGMSVREIQGDRRSARMATAAMYPVVFFDALRVTIRDEGVVRNKAIYPALGVRRDGTRDVLSLWIKQTEGAKFWLRVVNDLKLRGVQDILIAVVDGPKGFPEAINTVFPETTVQTYIVHQIRNSLDFASWKDRKSVAAALKEVYRAPFGRGGRRGAGCVRYEPVGYEIPTDCRPLAPGLGSGESVPRLRA
jgi:transposase-like protein